MSTDGMLSTHRLDNGLDLVFLDQSRQIAADRWYVCITVQISIPVEKKWFRQGAVDDLKFQDMLHVLGNTVFFEQKKDRNFVSADEKDNLIKEICKNTLETTRHYFARDDFAAKTILKQYTEKHRHLKS